MRQKIRKWMYQKVANMFMKILEKTSNDRKWQLIYHQALEFNQFCVDQDIYLD